MTASLRPSRHHTVLPAVAARPLRLGLVTPHNALDRRAFSGTVFHAARALGRADGVALRLVGPQHRTPGPLDRLRRRPAPDGAALVADLAGLDAVVGLVATPLLDALSGSSDLPFLHITDATPTFLRDTYGWTIPGTADAAEARVAARAATAIYSSAFMAARATRELGLPAHHAQVALFGINLDGLPEAIPPKQSLNRLNLLFVGADWTRKGGDMAVATLDQLRAGGCDARLTVAGRVPDAVRRHPAITAVGFLDKNLRRDRARLARLYSDAHFLLLPTRGDCTPMVLAEAMAHGTPVVAFDTGGVAEIIGGAGAGVVLQSSATPVAWADAIRALASDPMAYEFASDAAFDRARACFSWDGWAADIAAIARRVVSQQQAKAA